MSNKEQQPAIYPALIAIMRDVDAIGKEQRNQQQGFKYRGIDDVMNSLHGIFAAHGVVCLPVETESNSTERVNKNNTVLRFTTAKVTYHLTAQDGSFVPIKMIGTAMDGGDKSEAKAVSIALKYALTTAFLVPTAEQKDPDGDTYEPTPDADDRYSDEAITKKEKQRLKDQGLDPELAEPAYPKTANTSKRQTARRQDGELPDWMTNYTIEFIKSHKGKALAELNTVQLQAIARTFEKNAEACEKNEKMRRESQMIKRAILFHAEEGDKLEGVENP